MLFVKGWFAHVRSAHILRNSCVMKQIMVMFNTYRSWHIFWQCKG